ncbi:glycosyltransferase family 2 protein [Prochlorococcus marinus]|uniref:glycosyltransferase family 2 protein n=2 Tax=Prochlorococcus TaxID=1218 RepID=UPI0007BB8797|nr:glycosyltransferase family 2 protein [Prochlorococcus marinus]KZR78347.1 putative glycosyltransferase EpsE [Prochlorococcus marinus str. MIT 1323]
MGFMVIDVVLPVFNGYEYLEQQVASIASQTLRPRRLLIRDDGSSERVLKLIHRLEAYYSPWLVVLPSEGNVGCTANVNALLKCVEASYCALADQDDIWLPDKLERGFTALSAIEKRKGCNSPALVHSDLHLVDASLRPYGCTFMKRQMLNPALVAPSDLALTNVVTGCTALFNRALLDRAMPLPPEALVHDWWLALVASAYGEIGFIPTPSILYRQHQSNSIGAHGLGFRYWLKRLYQWFYMPQRGGHTLEAIRQIDCFEARYGLVISILPGLIRRKKVNRLLCLLKTQLSQWPHKHGLFRTIALYVWLFRYQAVP